MTTARSGTGSDPLSHGATGEPVSLLMTPGPTRVPARVLAAGARPMLHHRSTEFSRELAEMLELLGPVFGSRAPILPVHSTGRGAMEAAVCNLLSAGDEIVVCCNGKFGEMWARIAEGYGVVVHRAATAWDADIDPGEIDSLLERHPRVRALALTYCDTSTGGINDIAAIGRLATARGVLVLVDGVSAVGGMPFELDAWGVDVAITASQKCLMSSPGLAFAALSNRAWEAAAHARLPHAYWNFREIRGTVMQPRPETPGTAPVHLVLQVAEALRMLHDEGLANVHARHEEMGAIARREAAGLGLARQCPGLRRPSPTLTAIALPPSIDPKAVRDGLRARGIRIAAGLGPFESSGIRIGHMGDIRPADVRLTLTALGETLSAFSPSTGDTRA